MDRRRHFANQSVAHVSVARDASGLRVSDGTPMRVTTPVASIYARPGATVLERQILFGHKLTQLETANTMAFVRDETNGHVGYVRPTSLGPWVAPTHRVKVGRTFLFSEPDFKTPNPETLSCGSFLAIAGSEDRFLRTVQGMYVLAAHLMPIDTREPDPVSVAERHLGTPYLWGGNSAFGIDCSGLVQAGCLACGLECPGDSDMQQAELGKHLSESVSVQRGDLLFWKGHVAWVADAETLLHANAHHMAVTYEPMMQAIARIEAQGDGPVTARKRLELPK